MGDNTTANDFKKVYVASFIVMFAVCIAEGFDDKARNILLVVFMTVASCSLIFYRFVTKVDVYIGLFVFFLLFSPVFAHDVAPRWSTIIYSILFCTNFLAFYRAYLVSEFTAEDFLNVLRLLIFAYAVVLIIQQLSVILGIPPLNLRNYSPAEPFKLNSLGAEPSWSGRIIALLFYCYLTVKEHKVGRAYSLRIDAPSDRWVWFAFLWSMITMISGTAIVFMSLVFIKFAQARTIISFAALLVILISIFEAINFEPYERARDVTIAVTTLDEAKVIEADHSASFRIVPLMVLVKSVGLTTFSDYFGYGVDSVAANLDFNLGIAASSATFVGFWYEFGFIAFAVFMLFSVRLCVFSFQSFVFWFMLVFMYGLNTQIPWLGIILLFITKHLLFTQNKTFD